MPKTKDEALRDLVRALVNTGYGTPTEVAAALARAIREPLKKEDDQ